MRRNQQRNFGSDWRRDMDDRRDDRYPEDFEQRKFSGKDDSHRPYNRDFSRDFNSDMNRGSDFNRNMNNNFDEGMSEKGRSRFHDPDRDYTRDYNLGTGTSMRMHRYEEQGEDRGFFGKGPKGWKRSDDRVKEEICECLYDSRLVDASDIEVMVKEGHVTLTGSVESREAKREAERLVDGVRGVEDVQNNLKLSRNENVSEMRRSGSDTGKSASLS